MAGISNVTIEKFIEEENDDFKKTFVGVILSNSTTPFIYFLKMIKQKGSYYPFAVLNTRYALVEYIKHTSKKAVIFI